MYIRDIYYGVVFLFVFPLFQVQFCAILEIY